MDVAIPDAAWVWALLLFRWGGLMLVAPMFSAVVIPMRVKAAVTLLMSIVLLPPATAQSVAEVAFTPAALFSEVVVGMLIGLGAALFVGAAEVAGDALAVQTGLSGASLVDPMSRNQAPVVGQFMGLTALMLILAVDGHLIMIQAVGRSFEWVPVGSTINFEGNVGNVIRIGSSLFLLGLRFAGPVVGALMVGYVALGVLARTVPQMNVLMMAFPLQIAVGLFVLAATLPAIATAFVDWPIAYGDVVYEFLGRVAPTQGGS